MANTENLQDLILNEVRKEHERRRRGGETEEEE